MRRGPVRLWAFRQMMVAESSDATREDRLAEYLALSVLCAGCRVLPPSKTPWIGMSRPLVDARSGTSTESFDEVSQPNQPCSQQPSLDDRTLSAVVPGIKPTLLDRCGRTQRHPAATLSALH